jgi:hypothetical protein
VVELRGERGGELVVVVIARIRGRSGSRDGLLVHGGNAIGGLTGVGSPRRGLWRAAWMAFDDG